MQIKDRQKSEKILTVISFINNNCFKKAGEFIVIMEPVNIINKLLDNIYKEHKNNTNQIFINSIKNEFIKLNGRLIIPLIQVSELDYETAVSIITDIIEYIPEFLYHHKLLEKRIPASEQHTLQFIKYMNGNLFDYVHLFTIYLKFGGNPDNIIRKGDSNHYPSYYTDRIYYKSRLIPVLKKQKKSEPFSPVKLKESDYVSGDRHLFTSAIFDDMDKSGMTDNINRTINLDIFKIPLKLYPFITYDYFTSCLNILNPTEEEIGEAVRIIEPVFLFIFKKFNILDDLSDIDKTNDMYNKYLELDDNNFFSQENLNRLNDYFARFSIYRDDDLSLKGWWRIDIN